MALKKKDIPLKVLEILEPFVIKESKFYKIDYNSNSLLRFIDKDNNSDFYFEINKFEKDLITLIIKPYNKGTVNGNSAIIQSKDLGAYFSNWISILENYEKIKSVYDDPIINSFEEEFFSDFEILDDDKNKPLENNKILLLDEYLENLSNGLEKHKTEENKRRIEEIQENIILLQENLTNNTRQEIAEKISKIFAKIKKLGTKYLKEFITAGRKKLMDKGIKYIIENAPKIIDDINNAI